jgi:hypothetical protein
LVSLLLGFAQRQPKSHPTYPINECLEILAGDLGEFSQNRFNPVPRTLTAKDQA